MLRVAIIGLGTISEIHIAAIEEIKIREDVEIIAVCDIDESLGKHFKGVNFYKNINDMLDNEEVDVAHICLPHYLHLEVTRLCLNKGVHVFLEKPPGLDYREAWALSELEASSDKKVCLCLQNRLNPTTVELLECLKSEEAGQIQGIKGIVPWYRPKEYFEEKQWRGTKSLAGGGLMINQALHTLDLMQLICGKARRIGAMSGNLLDYAMEVEDTVVANIHFENDIRGFFMGTNANYTNSSVDIEVYCEKGRYVIRDSALMFFDREGCGKTLMKDQPPEGVKFYYGQSHKMLIEKFYRSITDGSDDYISAKEGNASMEIIEGIWRASSNMQTVDMQTL